MNAGQYHLLVNGLFTKLNRISKVSKYCKQEIHDILNEELSYQDVEMAHSRFISMIEEIEELIKQTKENYKTLTHENSTGTN